MPGSPQSSHVVQLSGQPTKQRLDNPDSHATEQEIGHVSCTLPVLHWRSECSERRHIQVMTIEICDIYKYVKFDHKCACAVIL